jgi:hypothetical protein
MTTPIPASTEVRRPQLEMLSSPLTWLLEAADDSLCEEITAALRGPGFFFRFREHGHPPKRRRSVRMCVVQCGLPLVDLGDDTVSAGFRCHSHR